MTEFNWSREAILAFFYRSDRLDYATLRPLSHVMFNWELIGSENGDPLFEEEEDSYAAHLNVLIDEIAATTPPSDYHRYENQIAAEYTDAINGRYFLKGKLWHVKQSGQPIQKDDVGHMMEQASSGSDDIPDLVLAAAGRIATAMSYGVANFDDLDRGHMEMLAIDLMTILFRRSDAPAG
jgi:hypothetical protein